MQSVVSVQETRFNVLLDGNASGSVAAHAGFGASASVDTTAYPCDPASAMHRPRAVQETSESSTGSDPGAILTGARQPMRVPFSWPMIALPRLSTATQSELVGHEMLVRPSGSPVSRGIAHEEPESRESTYRAPDVTAKHMPDSSHETP